MLIKVHPIPCLMTGRSCGYDYCVAHESGLTDIPPQCKIHNMPSIVVKYDEFTK